VSSLLSVGPRTETALGQRPHWANSDLFPADLLVIQPTPFCNIDCKYCYLSNRTDRSRMSMQTVLAVARFLRDVPVARNPLSVVWHAGEPLTAPISFYEGAFERMLEASTPLQHNFQTNATLITDAWCGLIRKWSVQVGVSIDGPKFIHDAHRVDRAGSGTFDRVMRGINKLREHGIPFSVLAVVTAASVNAPDEIWHFFKSLGTSRIALNIEESEGAHKSSSLGGTQTEAFKRFLSRLAELQFADPSMSVRELDNMRRHLSCRVGAQVHRSDNRPGAIINIDINGNITTFSPELLGVEHARYGKFVWGNVHQNCWTDLLANPGFRAAHEDIARGVEQCRQTCPYFLLCGGGSPSNKLFEHESFSVADTQYCRFQIQSVADVVMEKMEAELELKGTGSYLPDQAI